MSTSDRPSGLTALAVINFIFGFVQLIASLVFPYRRFVGAPREVERGMPKEEAFADKIVALLELTPPQAIWNTFYLFATGALLILAGVGYLRRSRRLGLRLTTIYVGIEVLGLVLALTWMPESYLRQMGVAVIRMAFFPLFLGVVIHTVFRRDFVR